MDDGARHRTSGDREGRHRPRQHRGDRHHEISERRRSSGIGRRAARIHRAIVCRIAARRRPCQAQGGWARAMVQERTGLLLDPYFSGTKIAWLLDNVPGARARAEKGDLAFARSTVSCCGGSPADGVHATDATNASRTLLFNIREGRWDADLCALLKVPMAMLPGGAICAADFGLSDASHSFGASIPSPHCAAISRPQPSGRPVSSRHDEIDLWNWLLRAAEPRARRRSPRRTSC